MKIAEIKALIKKQDGEYELFEVIMNLKLENEYLKKKLEDKEEDLKRLSEI